MKNRVLLTVIILLSMTSMLFSQNIVYRPINPSFGGNAFNYQQLFAAATAQSDFQDDDSFDFSEESELDNFAESLNRQLLNRISQNLFQQQFGDESLGVGTFVFGSLVIEISPTSNGLSVNILDTNTGDQTLIIIPN
ncbi:MAG: curli assembly protein CsgF [Sulfurovum sp.]|nr:MAG: curli assembly protein CsgF [Sulfurovum sp.]